MKQTALFSEEFHEIEDNSKKLILDLCGGSGAWSRPYKNEGYTVLNITLPFYDILKTDIRPEFGTIVFQGGTSPQAIISAKDVYGILSAPPCTMFSFARTNAKTPRDLRGSMALVKACLDVIWECQYNIGENDKTTTLKFWCLENPVQGLLYHFLGSPSYTFEPYEFGDNYKKKTALWGNFNEPKKLIVISDRQTFLKFDILRDADIHPEYYGVLRRDERRAMTSKKFAQAFFEANK